MRYIFSKRVVLSSLLLLASLGLLTSRAYIYGLNGQKGGGDEITVDKATVRESNRKLRARDGFEFVQEGKNRVSVRRFGATTKAKGTITCSCNERDNTTGICEAVTSQDGRTTSCSEYGCSSCAMHF